MAILTAEKLKALEHPEFTVDIGGGNEVLVRRPDVEYLVLKGLLPAPLLKMVIGLVTEWVGNGPLTMPDEVVEHNEELLQFVNTMCCTCCVQPRIVPVGEDPGEDGVPVDALTLSTRKRIVVAISQSLAPPEVVAAATEFPQE